MNNKLYYPDSPLPRTVLEKKYASSEEIVQILAEWAYKNHFELVIRKNDKDRRVHLHCKFEGNSTLKDITDRQRRRKSVKTDCPFILKITYSKKAPEDSKWKVLEQDCSKNENAHNHSLTLEECQLLPKAKKSLIGSDTIDVVQRMISAGNSVPEIKKTIDGTDGKSILTYNDIRNWKVEVMSHDKSMDKFGNSASDLIRRMEGRDYIVRYQASSDGKNVKSIFFMHSSAAVEISVRGEVFGIDATYKVNNKAMPLVSIQTVSHLGGKSLMTTPIAYAIVSDESAETYTWILEHIKKLTEDKKPVFISDKALFVMKALKTVFPDSVHLLCTWHMLENFKTTLAHVFVNPIDKTSCMMFVNDMINSSSEENFQIALDNYKKYATDDRKLTYSGKYKTINEKVKSQKDHFGKNDSDPVKYYKAMEYLNNHWLPLKEKWAGYLVSQTYNFGCKTTSRIEGSHAALKASLLSTRSSLDVCFDEVDKYIKRQLMRFHHTAIEEKVKIDCFVKSEKSMKYLLGQVSAWALDAIYGEILKINRSNGDIEASQECNQCQNVRYKLPCKHMILNAIKSHGCIPLNLVDSRWLLDSKKAFVDTGVDISKEKVAFSKTMYQKDDGNSNQMFASLLSGLQLVFRDCRTTSEVTRLCESLTEAASNSKQQILDARAMNLEYPDISQVKKIGRPALERVYLPYKADSNKRKRQDPPKLDLNEFHVPQRKIKKTKSSELPNDSALVTDSITRHNAISSSSCDKYLDSKLPRNESFIKILDNSGEGDCGFKALAQQMYNENESFHVLVQALMLSTLEENKEFYTTCFDQDPSLLNYADMKHILSTKHSWFKAPGCAQIAADTFGRPIAVYPYEGMSYHSLTFLPLLPYKHTKDKINPGSSPIPLILQNEGNVHWFTVVYKKSHKLTYPQAAKWHKSQALKQMNLHDKRNWRHLTFFKDSSQKKAADIVLIEDDN